MAFLDEKFETMPVDEIKAMQLRLLKELVKSTSLTAARSLGLEKVGMIRTGYHADMVLLDEDFSVAGTIVDGEVRYQKNDGIFA